MATANAFDLLMDVDNDDPSVLIEKQQQKAAEAAAAAAAAAAVAAKKEAPATAPASSASAAATTKAAKFPTKPPPPAQAVRDAKNEAPRGGGRGGGRGYGRGRGFNRESFGGENAVASDNGFSSGNRSLEDKESGRSSERTSERREYGGPRGGFRGGHRGGFSNGETEEGERPRRPYERRSGTGRGSEFKKDGAGRRNWGTAADEIPQGTEEPAAETETNVSAEKQVVVEEQTADTEKETSAKEPEEKEPEEKEMTLEEYEKVLEEKRKAVLALKAQERKVDVDKEFESMQLVSKKKDNEDIFVKLGSDKDKRREAAEKEERAKKAVSINEFLKPSEGDTYYRPGGRGRGRGRGVPRGGFNSGYASNSSYAPSIEDPGQFPSLGAK